MTGSSWLITALAGFICSWIVIPPTSTAGRAAWTALGIGFLASAILQVFEHRAVLVLALPLAAAAPLAVIRRNRAGSQSQPVPAARWRVRLALLGSMLFALGINLALIAESRWAVPVGMLGAAMVAGVLPFHRVSTETLRAAPADLRAPAVLMLGPALWIPLARWTSILSQEGLPSGLPVLTLWLGAFLVLARGDLARLSSAAFLLACGQVATAACDMRMAGVGVATAVAAPLLLVVLLLAKLERTSETRDLSELGGLARSMPCFSVALLAAVFWLVGTAAWPQSRLLLLLTSTDSMPGSAWQAFRRTWPILVPQVIAVWGWTMVVRDLLVGPARSPLFPEALRDRVPTPPADRPLTDLTPVEIAAIVMLAVVALFA